ncbi:MAG: hypothetical protein FAF03_00405 [Epsilonproteobacteria bacterium]|nr:hypothetical protein [Campylobacterota bacterium]
MQTIKMDSNSKTQDIWFGYTQKLLLIEEKPLLKEECNILYKPMMQYSYDSFSEKSLIRIQKKLTQCIEIIDKKYNLKYLLGEVNRVLKSKGVPPTLIQK